jgi:hypothetical protein
VKLGSSQTNSVIFGEIFAPRILLCAFVFAAWENRGR